MSKNQAPRKGDMIERPKSEVGTVLPDFMKGQAGAGLEQVKSGDYEVPRVKLIQKLSPEITEHGIQFGHFFHTILEEDLGSQITVVPIYVTKEFILWKPRDSGGGILARARDEVHWEPPSGEFSVQIDKGRKTVVWRLAPTVEQSGLARWGSFDPSDPQSQPAATFMVNVAVVLPARPELGPAVLTFQRSSIAPGRRWLGKMRMSTAPIYGRRFIVSAVDDRNKSNQEFLNYRIEGVGLVEDEVQFTEFRRLYEMFRDTGLKVKDIEGLQGEDVAPGGDAGGSSEPEAGKPSY